MIGETQGGTLLIPAHIFVPALALLLWLIGGPAFADQLVPLGNGWQTYVNDRFGMRFDVPADFQPAPLPENGDGRSFEKGDASIYIFASHNTQRDSPRTFKKQLIGTKGYENVTYSPSGDTWLVISGFRGERIFYEKYFFHDGVISAFGMDFPKEDKPRYAPVIERIEDSFRAGRPD
jgi:hypothetical protein